MTAISTASKFDLRVSCIQACRGDVGEAERLYKFLAEGLEDLPDLTPTPPTAFEQIRQGAAQLFTFLRDNRDDITQAVAYVQTLRGHAPQTTEAAADLPPLDTTDAPPTSTDAK